MMDDIKSPLVPALASQVVAMIRREGLGLGEKVTEQILCDELGVSRSPVRKVLQYLEHAGVVRSEPRRGFRVAKSLADLATLALPQVAESDDALYQMIGDDYLNGRLLQEVSETALMQRFDSTRLQVQRVLNRMARDGIVAPKPGRGWVFQAQFNTPEAHRESYRFRMMLEPSALMEPGYAVDLGELDKCYREQSELLASDMQGWFRPELFRTGVHLHETIVAGANNRLLLDALHKINQMRRLVEYSANIDEQYTKKQCEEHLILIDLLRRGERYEAAHFLREHLNQANRRKTGA